MICAGTRSARVRCAGKSYPRLGWRLCLYAKPVQLTAGSRHVFAFAGGVRALRKRQTWHDGARVFEAVLQPCRFAGVASRPDANTMQQAQSVRIPKRPQRARCPSRSLPHRPFSRSRYQGLMGTGRITQMVEGRRRGPATHSLLNAFDDAATGLSADAVCSLTIRWRIYRLSTGAALFRREPALPGRFSGVVGPSVHSNMRRTSSA